MPVTAARVVVAAALVAVMVIPPGARAGSGSIDLRDEYDIKIVGAGFITAAGDVNGDGIPDVLVSKGGVSDEPTRGRSWVVFGRTEPGVIDLEDVARGDGGFVIVGAAERDYAAQIAGVGDVNGDGLDDIVIGASGAGNNMRESSGTAYVVFGKTTTEPVQLQLFNLNAQAMGGFRIDGPHFLSIAGQDVASGGDINGDGLDDIIVGAPFAGATYVVFGKPDPVPVDLLTFEEGIHGPAGYRIGTPTPSFGTNYSVGGAGDVNGDGIPDVLIGVIRRDGSTGTAYVVFGKADRDPADVTELGSGGFRIKGAHSGSQTGYSVDGAGDGNGDGLDDVIVGAPGLLVDAHGDAYVVFGKKGSKTVPLNRLGGRGYRIKGGVTNKTADNLGVAVARIGNHNGDGLDDVIVGAHGATVSGRRAAGAAFVVHGKGTRRTVHVARLGAKGFAMHGPTRRSWIL